MVMTRNQIKAAKDAIAWTGPLTRSKAAARNQWVSDNTAWNPTITIEDVAAATVLVDLKEGSWNVETNASNSIATRRPRRSCRRD